MRKKLITKKTILIWSLLAITLISVIGACFIYSKNENIVFIDNSNDYQKIEDLIALKNLKGNVLYFDIWSTNCGPCLREFQQSKELKERYKDKPVKFVYLADLGKRDNARWKFLIKKYKLYGYHFQMSNIFFTNINSIMDIKFIGKPHFILVDKNGDISYPNAERPSSKEKLYEQIDKLL